MRNMLAILIVPTLLLGCSSLVAPGQTREEMEASGALKWALTEYDYAGSHYVWIPHWVEGALHVSTPTAANCKRLDVLQFDTHDNEGETRLTAVYELGSDRQKWAQMLKRHGRIVDPPGSGMAGPLFMAVTERIVLMGAPTEAVLFACGFPSHGPNFNPKVKRSPYELKKDDVLYYTTSKGGRAQEIVLKDGKVSEILEAEYASKFWNGFYTR